MKQIPKEIYSKIKLLNKDVKQKLLSQGVVVPVRNKDGTIKVGKFIIKRLETGFYSILDYRYEQIINNINLPQTAAVVANKLALGKWLDDTLLSCDTRYGHALFDEELHKKMGHSLIQKKDIDRAELMFTKSEIAKRKKEKYKKEIDLGFMKLMNFR